MGLRRGTDDDVEIRRRIAVVEDWLERRAPGGGGAPGEGAQSGDSDGEV